MHAYGTQLKDYYQRELSFLRDDAAVFASSYPAQAQALSLDREGSHDPHVEMLMQSFAFLTGRVQYESEVSKALIPNVLLNYLYPHLAAPIPCMLIAQARVKPDAAVGEVVLRNRQVSVTSEDTKGVKSVCRFTTTCDTPLLPLGVIDVRLVQPVDFPSGMSNSLSLSALKVRINTLGSDPVKTLHGSKLRFYIDTNQKEAYFLQELLSRSLRCIEVAPIDGALALAPKNTTAKLNWIGFSEDEAALPSHVNNHPGHRLMQEYFSFPEKFMFFEVDGLDLTPYEKGFDLYFEFTAPVSKNRRLSKRSLKLNCIPLVNLYRQRIEPLLLNHTQYEYQLTADIQNRKNSEIYNIEDLVAIQKDGSQKKVRPYFDLSSVQDGAKDDCFYVMRRELNQLNGIDGTEVYLSFLDVHQQDALPASEVIGGRALCTNRQLPEQLAVKQVMQLEGSAPITGLEVVSRASPYLTPPLVGRRPWALVSQLGLSHLSLANGSYALPAFKKMLRSYLSPSQIIAFRCIEGLQKMECLPGMRYLVRGGKGGYINCLNIKLTMHRQHFDSASTVLFGSVLRHFLALYATVNTVVVVSLDCMDEKGGLMSWPPLVGNQIIL